jgi:rod shape-determining protein MreD
MDGIKAAVVLFVCAMLQVAVLTEYAAFRSASIVLVALLSISLLRGSVFGAVAGFGTGLLLDTATLGTLGVTSLLLTVAGFWIGRYGETTARDRFHAPFLSVAVVTVLFAFGQVLLQFMLGEPAPAGLVAGGLPIALLLNLALTLPVYALVRRLFPPRQLGDRIGEVRLLG